MGLNIPVYVHAVGEGTELSVYKLSAEMFVVVCQVGGKAGKLALVEHCQRCAWATCHRITSSGKWKELAPEVEEDEESPLLPPVNLHSIGPAHKTVDEADYT